MTWVGKPAEVEPPRFFTAWRTACDAVDAALKTGLRLAILGRPAIPEGLSAGTFWGIALLGTVVSGIVAWFSVEAPREFSLEGLQSEGFYTLATLFACYLTVRAFRQVHLLWPLATLIFGAGLLAAAVIALVQDHLLDALVQQNQRWNAAVVLISLGWWVAIWRVAMTALSIGPNARQRSAAALVIVVLLAVLAFKVGGPRLWEKDYRAEYELKHANDEPPLIAEEVFARQHDLLDRALETLAPGTPGRPDLYFIAFGAYGRQGVFMKESLYSTRLFEKRFGAQGRTLALVNNREKVNELPLASVTNLERSLKWIGAHIDPEEDLVFLFLTSHGSEDAELSVRLEGLSFTQLTAPALASMLQASGIKWKVLVISSCYSGSFIDSVKDDHTLVISAARADRTSFGCSDGAEFTYFGRAYFEQALNQTTSFVDAFDIASGLVGEWEKREGHTSSEPQIVRGKLIDAKLKEWRATLPRTAAQRDSSLRSE